MNSPNIDLQMVYSPHGAFDIDREYQLFDDIFPAFFRDGALNLLGVESAGTHTTEQRDAFLKRAAEDPITHVVDHEGLPQDQALLVEAVSLAGIMCEESEHRMLLRQPFILRHWNQNNPAVLPFIEAYSSKKKAQEIDRKTVNFHMTLDGRDWRSVAAAFRSHVERSIRVHQKREKNWAVNLQQLMKKHRKKSSQELRVLVNLGISHWRLTDLVRKRVANICTLHPDIFIPAREEYVHPLFYLEEKLKNGEQVADEEFIRALLYNKFYDVIKSTSRLHPCGTHGTNRTTLQEVWDYCFSLPFPGVLTTLSLVSFEHAGQAGPSIRQIGEEVQEIIADRVVFPLREDHPHNSFLDEEFLTSVFAVCLEISDRQDPAFALIRECVRSAITSQNDLRMAVREQAISVLLGRNPNRTVLDEILGIIAEENPDAPQLWASSPELREHSHRIVSTARRNAGRIAPLIRRLLRQYVERMR